MDRRYSDIELADGLTAITRTNSMWYAQFEKDMLLQAAQRLMEHGMTERERPATDGQFTAGGIARIEPRIVQIAVSTYQQGGYYQDQVYGLASDGLVYAWNAEKEVWERVVSAHPGA